MLGRMDVFRLQRVAFGAITPSARIERAASAGSCYRRTARPAPPEQGFGDLPPGAPELKDKFFRKVQWNDEPVVGARNQQDAWYEWQTKVVWASAGTRTRRSGTARWSRSSGTSPR